MSDGIEIHKVSLTAEHLSNGGSPEKNWFELSGEELIDKVRESSYLDIPVDSLKQASWVVDSLHAHLNGRFSELKISFGFDDETNLKYTRLSLED